MYADMCFCANGRRSTARLRTSGSHAHFQPNHLSTERQVQQPSHSKAARSFSDVVPWSGPRLKKRADCPTFVCGIWTRTEGWYRHHSRALDGLVLLPRWNPIAGLSNSSKCASSSISCGHWLKQLVLVRRGRGPRRTPTRPGEATCLFDQDCFQFKRLSVSLDQNYKHLTDTFAPDVARLVSFCPCAYLFVEARSQEDCAH